MIEKPEQNKLQQKTEGEILLQRRKPFFPNAALQSSNSETMNTELEETLAKGQFSGRLSKGLAAGPVGLQSPSTPPYGLEGWSQCFPPGQSLENTFSGCKSSFLGLGGQDVLTFLSLKKEKSRTELQEMLVLHNSHTGKSGQGRNSSSRNENTEVFQQQGKVFLTLASLRDPTVPVFHSQKKCAHQQASLQLSLLVGEKPIMEMDIHKRGNLY